MDVFSFWQRRWRWIIAITLLLVVRALLPPTVRHLITTRASKAINARVEVANVDLWLLRGGIALDEATLPQLFGAAEPATHASALPGGARERGTIALADPRLINAAPNGGTLSTTFRNCGDVSLEGSFARMGEGQDEGDPIDWRSRSMSASARSMPARGATMVAFGIIKSPSPQSSPIRERKLSRICHHTSERHYLASVQSPCPSTRCM